MTSQAFALPFLTEADPEQAGEGSLNPLGLASVADRLADEIAPGITARMSRIRFVTAIAAGAVATESLSDAVASDGVSPAYLAYEWLVVEALARDRYLPPSATLRVPGITKARTVLARKAHMDSRSYLKTPKVFGFHGIYKRLARDFDLVDDELMLGPAGDRLVRVWEEEHALPGFADRKPGTRGGRLASSIQSAVASALANSQVTTSLSAHLWAKLVSTLRPDGALPRERELLLEHLTDPEQPIRREFVLGIHNMSPDGGEAEMLRFLQTGASPGFKARLRAIDAYEHVAELLTASLDAMRRISTARGTSPVDPDELTLHPVLVQASGELPGALAEAYSRLERVGDVLTQAVLVLAEFDDVTTPSGLVQALLFHHEQVQERKGKRPWFEQTPRGFVVRPLYRAGKDAAVDRRYVHPYRATAVRSFLDDLTA